MDKKLSPSADYLLKVFQEQAKPQESGNMHVNPLISTVASLYEKLRNVMDFRQEEVVLRAAIERIVKRRLLLGGKGTTIAEPLLRELAWARYVTQQSVSEQTVERVGNSIEVYFFLRKEILARNLLKEHVVNEWIYHLLSADIEHIVHPLSQKNVMANVMYHILKQQVVIADDSEQTKDVQVFIAVRRSFGKDDIAFLRYHLFSQFFGELTKANVETTGANFMNGYNEIQSQLNYKIKDRLYGYVHSKTPAFLILKDILDIHKTGARELVLNDEELTKAIQTACTARYAGIRQKVNRAIIRSVIFILLTKTFFAFAIEGSVENLLYGGIDFRAMAINISLAPLVMVLVGLTIRIPGKKNSDLIEQYIRSVLFEKNPVLGRPLETRLHPEKSRPFMNAIFMVLWLLAFLLTFGFMVFVLGTLHMNYVSQLIFIFFLTIVSFLSYRISLTSQEYSVERRPGLVSPITDFFFMPIIRVGRNLTEGISQINILLFVFDFIIETPFKGMFSFFEQWFFYLHAKREELE